MYNKSYSPSPIVLLLETILFLCLVAFAQTTTTRCGPQPSLSICSSTPECEGIVRKSYSRGCIRKNGRSYHDGGCQCQGYCGYKCASACKADPECGWNKSQKKCFNLATGEPGKPLETCTATNTPTSVVGEPTKQPTLRGFCMHDTTFPGIEFDPNNTRTVAMSTNGDVILFSESSWLDNGNQSASGQRVPVTNVWLTKWNGKHKRWYARQVGRHVNKTRVAKGAMNDDGTQLIYYIEPIPASTPYYRYDMETVIVMLMPEGDYYANAAFKFGRAFDAHPNYWMHPNGYIAIVSYIEDVKEPKKRTFTTKTYVREEHYYWSLVKIQEGVFLERFSRDGKTAFTKHLDPQNLQSQVRRTFVRKNKKWIMDGSDITGSGSPKVEFQGSEYSGFSSDGKAFVMGSAVHDYVPGNTSHVPDDSGAYVFFRSHGNWTQQGPKLGGGNLREGAFTGISDDRLTIMLSDGNASRFGSGFKIYKKNGNTWTQVGGFVLTDAIGTWLNAKGDRVVTIQPPSVWDC